MSNLDVRAQEGGGEGRDEAMIWEGGERQAERETDSQRDRERDEKRRRTACVFFLTQELEAEGELNEELSLSASFQSTSKAATTL